ncbi:hypothetical protein LX36DRAFT_459996 [Colletotrichum falcatum]|nr:hypothetical protein LX36DRAFT_459996 [Colletotrichum falcatum]
MLPDMGSQSSLEALERRKKKLQSKALRGALTSDEFDEMMHVAAQLTQAAKAPAAVISPDPHPREQAPEKKNEERRKRKRQAPAADAAQYWARREEKEREREAKNRARRGGVPNTAGKTNQAKLPDDDESDLDESEVDKRNYIQIEKILETYDAIQHRADQGDLPAAPNITATRTNDQLKQMREAAPGYSDPEILGKQVQELRLATKAWGARAVRCKDGNWKVRGLLTPLLSHQLIMGSWMMGRELLAMRNLPRGGILADAMGLGKTLETLSCIVGNQASESLKDAGKGATLVICPSGQMIDQWMLEVKKHCNSRFSRRIVHFKAGDKMDSESLSSFNIVFATYQQVRASIPSTKLQQTMQKRLADPKEYAEWLKEQKGVLHLIEWRRVVLDEAHSIKNHLTHAASACFELKATYRWAVSGTPLINSASELFSYLKLIRCPGLGDFNEYFQKYESTPKARKRRDRLGYQVLYRRIQSDLFLDQPMLSLPTTHPTHQYLTLSAEEMVIFRMMEKCFRNELNQDMESGAAVGQIRSYLVMLLRLRQAATHPFLLEGMMRDYFSLKDLKITKEKLKALKGGPTVYSQIGPWSQRQRAPNKRFEEVLSEVDKLKQKRLEDARQECLEALKTRLGECDKQNEARTGTCQDANMTGNDAITIDDSDEVDSQDEVEEDEDGMVPQRTVSSIVGPEIDLDSTAPVAEDEPQLDPFGRSDFGLKFDMTKQIEYLERLQEIETTACVVCRAQPPKEPVKGRCGCSFCKRCVVDHFSNKKMPQMSQDDRHSEAIESLYQRRD